MSAAAGIYLVVERDRERAHAEARRLFGYVRDEDGDWESRGPYNENIPDQLVTVGAVEDMIDILSDHFAAPLAQARVEGASEYAASIDAERAGWAEREKQARVEGVRLGVKAMAKDFDRLALAPINKPAVADVLRSCAERCRALEADAERIAAGGNDGTA